MKVVAAKITDRECDMINVALREYINNHMEESSNNNELKEYLWDVAQLKGHINALKRYK